MIIPGKTISTPASTFSNPERLNFLKVKIEINDKAGITAKYKILSTIGESVIKNNFPATRKAKVAKNQIKNPIAITGIVNGLFVLFIYVI